VRHSLAVSLNATLIKLRVKYSYKNKIYPFMRYIKLYH